MPRGIPAYANLANDRLFIKTCERGMFEHAKKQYATNPKVAAFKCTRRTAFMGACERGRLNIAQWLHEMDPSITIDDRMDKYNILRNWIPEAIRLACMNGHLHVVQWLISVYPDHHISPDDVACFIDACLNNHLEVAQWVLSVQPKLKIHHYIEHLFTRLCASGRLHVAKWVYANYTSHIDLCKIYNELLEEVLMHRKFAVVQWLHSIKPESIDLSGYDEEAFVHQCRKGYLKFAQWLLQVNPNIDISWCEEMAFMVACKNKHYDIAKWLFSIKPTLKISAHNSPRRDNLSHLHRKHCERDNRMQTRLLSNLHQKTVEKEVVRGMPLVLQTGAPSR